MEYLLKISPKAEEDFDGIYNYVIKDGESIAKNQIAVILDALETLKLFPETGIKLSNKISTANDYRFLVINKTYIAFYKIHDGFIGVYRILRKEQDYLKALDF